jgi:hypothetical protein
MGLAWIVIGFEMSAPLALFVPLHLVLVFAFAGVTFHVVNALLMGLHNFVWAFLAAYPCLAFVRLEVLS